MFTKMLIIIVMIIIFSSLISGLIFLVRDKKNSTRTVKALTWRIGLSICLFFFLFLAFKLHWLTPHSI